MPLVFAYGSNMSSPRLRARVEVEGVHGAFALMGHRIAFHKIGADGSGKADAQQTRGAGDQVWGVLYELLDEVLPILDRYEGVGYGYDRVQVEVLDPHGNSQEAWMYQARPSATDPTLRPYDWYMLHVERGAREHGLPPSWVTALEQVPRLPDHDESRRVKELSVYLD